ncbi:MAG: (2Fe-2S)-binding protein [Deltaproteobacteria bacterium]|jgi:aerobic carbon-monoxide dehydrogenase small subunit|nr:(2Fe-2S)-binding protein [Deltaproteobacteria bacterium]
MEVQEIKVEIEVNGTFQQLTVAPQTTLLELLREQIGLKGTKQGCGVGQCGACTVLLNGNPVNTCSLLAVQAHGHKVETIESVANQDQLHPLQEAFVAEHAVQCGFCTPGMVMSSIALLKKTSQPKRKEILQAISGNTCRCTGYSKIVKAVEHVVDDRITRITISPDREAVHD